MAEPETDVPLSAIKARAGRRTHIGLDGEKVFCGNTIRQQTKEGPAKLWRVPPWRCTCRVCLTKFYTENPLTEKRTKNRDRHS